MTDDSDSSSAAREAPGTHSRTQTHVEGRKKVMVTRSSSFGLSVGQLEATPVYIYTAHSPPSGLCHLPKRFGASRAWARKVRGDLSCDVC